MVRIIGRAENPASLVKDPRAIGVAPQLGSFQNVEHVSVAADYPKGRMMSVLPE
tara:strand:+ start:1288 stop:1449 length:162 start_codon:yes stop_codon:yes gene_type:complete